MNTKLSMRDKKLLLIFLGIAVFALGYFLVFRPQMAKAEALRAENVPLREKLNELKEIEENKEKLPKLEEDELKKKEPEKLENNKPKINVDVDSIVMNDNVITDDEFFDDFFGDE